MSISEKLNKCLKNEPANRILPFFWQHGEDDGTILEELHRIYESGVGALCVESRPHEGFARDPWWEDMRLILDESKKLGLDVWVLDDKYFPTGFCNGAVKERFPELGKRGITERHVDVKGPISGGAVILEGWGEDGDELLAVIACKRGGRDEILTGEPIDFTDNVSDGLIYVDLPEGVWRIFMIFERPVKDGRVDFTNPESVDLMFSEIYEPHLEHLGKYFGNTFKGFFSDEPFIMEHAELPLRGKTKSKGVYPWNKYIKEDLAERVGEDEMIRSLPSLWFTFEGVTPKFRVAYMDTLSLLYKKHFCDRVGKWCRSHGVDYIGHIVEDYGQHSNTGSGGHYFRSLDGQSMAGIDVVLHQIVPGMTEHANCCLCWYDTADPDFFHFSLAKLAASHAHIQPEKKGRALCEIFGAYGWAEGLKMMKWLADHMLVRGINHFVPHAFSAKLPDEVPPQFSGAGHNPQFRYFRILMEYMNRVSEMLTGGTHICSAAILYHAEAEWTGADYMSFYEPARILTENQIDFDVIPIDYLLNAEEKDGKMVLADNEYDCFIIPYSEFLPRRASEKIRQLSESGVDIVFVDGLTEQITEGGEVCFKGPHIIAAELSSLPSFMRGKGYYDVSAGAECKYLRFYHSSCDGEDVYMLTNESIDGPISPQLRFSAFESGQYTVYKPLENRAYECESPDGNILIELQPYESVILIFNSNGNGLEKLREEILTDSSPVNCDWRVSLCCAEDFPAFGEPERLEGLVNMTSADKYPRFGGFMKYTAEFDFSPVESKKHIIDLGKVGETAEVRVNGKECGIRIIPPYRFDITDALRNGGNTVEVIVANHLGYEQRDLCSKYLLMEPSGLLGPVFISTYEVR